MSPIPYFNLGSLGLLVGIFAGFSLLKGLFLGYLKSAEQAGPDGVSLASVLGHAWAEWGSSLSSFGLGNGGDSGSDNGGGDGGGGD